MSEIAAPRRAWHPAWKQALLVLSTAIASAAATLALRGAVASQTNPSSAHGPFTAAARPRLSLAAPKNLGAIWGRAFADHPGPHESLVRAEAQADAIPAGARLSRAHNSVSFTGRRVALTIVASPPNGRDMTFRSAGLTDPTIEVRRGTEIRLTFVNGDNDSAHGWLLLSPVVEVGGSFHGPRAFPGAYAPMLGDPTAAGQPLETISFRASRAGSYMYECPVPGHAAMGMHGRLIVS